MKIDYDLYPSPIGTLVLVATEKGLGAIGFVDNDKPWQDSIPPHLRSVESHRKPGRFEAIREWLDLYFAGRKMTFSDFSGRMDLTGTSFQKEVWSALKAIPYGHTTTYGEIARALGKPGGMRAVGMANGSNPLPILIPCHRVIGSDGKLTGFAGGLQRKSALLALEQGGELFEGKIHA